MNYRIPFDQLWPHIDMLRDQTRTRVFDEALRAVVRPADVVLDVGTGSGVLAMLAARAGARRVYAVESSGIHHLARELVSRNGLANVIEVIEADAREVQLPEPVDVIVSELLGGYGIDENFLAALAVARDRLLAPGGRMIPSRVEVLIAPAADENIVKQRAFWDTAPYGLDFSPIGERMGNQHFYAAHYLGPADMLAPAQTVIRHDLRSATPADLSAPFSTEFRFTVERDARLTALAGWFAAELADGIVLSNGPASPRTHWGRTIFPLGRPFEVRTGEVLDVRFSWNPIQPGQSSAGWSVKLGGEWHHRGDHAEGR